MNNGIQVKAIQGPNPLALKFQVDGRILGQGSVMIKTPEDAKKISPLAQQLFEVQGVSSVFINPYFITVQITGESGEWGEFLGPIRTFIKSYLSNGVPVFNSDYSYSPPVEAKNELERNIQQLLIAQILPPTQNDGGEITFASLDNGVLKVNLSGACINCPFAPRTIKNGVEVLVKRHFPEIKEVTSDDVDWSKTQQA